MPRIAIPTPTSFDMEYNRLNWTSYSEAIAAGGGEPVEIRLDLRPVEVADLVRSCQGILLPGSPADVNPAKYGHERDPVTAPADPARENVDELLLQEAHNLYKPLLGICFGVQMLNVWRGGTLVQDLTILPVNHSAARGVQVAHTARITTDSILASILDEDAIPEDGAFVRLPVNSSHHQAIGVRGDGLRIVARCPQDNVIEAVEGSQNAAGVHFVLGLQWHPERTCDSSLTSRAIFKRFVAESAAWRPRAVTASVLAS